MFLFILNYKIFKEKGIFIKFILIDVRFNEKEKQIFILALLLLLYFFINKNYF